MLVAQGFEQRLRRQLAKPLQRPQRLHARLRARTIQPLRFQFGRGVFELPLDQQLLNHVALPSAGTVDRPGQPKTVERVEPLELPWPFASRINSIKSSAVLAGAQIYARLDFLQNPLRVLNHVAVHVGDPQRAVGAELDRGGPEPYVAGGYEFKVGFVGRALARES